jgi:outer membrane protein OmpA-like peptidoglycan-associated protein
MKLLVPLFGSTHRSCVKANTREKGHAMGSIVTRMKTGAWLAVGLVPLLGLLQLEAAVFDPPAQKKGQTFEPPTIAVQETAREVKLELPGEVWFEFDQWDLRPAAEAPWQQVAEIIQRYPKAKITIAGYTDAKGAETANLQLSARRATSVNTWLVQQGRVDGKRMTTKGWGEGKPVAPPTHPDGSDNPEGRQKNRRVELTVQQSADGLPRPRYEGDLDDRWTGPPPSWRASRHGGGL